MPYIVQESRDVLDQEIDKLSQLVNHKTPSGVVNLEGNINYTVTKLLKNVYTKDGRLNYDKVNRIVGVLECIKLEFYRKVAAPYEDQKEFENGEV